MVPNGSEWKDGDVVACLADLNNNRIEFGHFRDATLHKWTLQVVRELSGLAPTISVSPGFTFEVNFGRPSNGLSVESHGNACSIVVDEHKDSEFAVGVLQ